MLHTLMWHAIHNIGVNDKIQHIFWETTSISWMNNMNLQATCVEQSNCMHDIDLTRYFTSFEQAFKEKSPKKLQGNLSAVENASWGLKLRDWDGSPSIQRKTACSNAKQGLPKVTVDASQSGWCIIWERGKGLTFLSAPLRY